MISEKTNIYFEVCLALLTNYIIGQYNTKMSILHREKLFKDNQIFLQFYKFSKDKEF